MGLLVGGKYDGRMPEWVPAEYLESDAGKRARGIVESVPVPETKVDGPAPDPAPGLKPEPEVPVDPTPAAVPVPDEVK